jgi:hypothetical protein
VILLPQLVFFLLGQRSGAFFLAMAMLHTALLYLIQVVSTSPACGLLGWTTVDQFVTTAAAPLMMTCHGAVDDLLGDATRAMGHVSDVGSLTSSSGWLSAVMVSKGNESPHGIFINRLSLILFVSSFAFFHENRRSLALRQIEDTLRYLFALFSNQLIFNCINLCFYFFQREGGGQCELAAGDRGQDQLPRQHEPWFVFLKFIYLFIVRFSFALRSLEGTDAKRRTLQSCARPCTGSSRWRPI